MEDTKAFSAVKLGQIKKIIRIDSLERGLTVRIKHKRKRKLRMLYSHPTGICSGASLVLFIFVGRLSQCEKTPSSRDKTHLSDVSRSNVIELRMLR